jgi:hypothetical protein
MANQLPNIEALKAFTPLDGLKREKTCPRWPKRRW